MSAPAMPPRRTDTPSVSPPQQAGGGRASWISDLLSRASQDLDEAGGRGSPPPRDPDAGGRGGPPPRDPDAGGRGGPPPRDPDAGGRGGPPPRDPDAGTPHSIESLDSLAADIVRMIDHDTAADLWDYKGGERNLFTRDTMQGQKAFEEIRRKYRSDRDFMRTVDRYVGEFERLFVEVSRADRGLARTYLTSEVGELYAVLAHAVGRFD